MQTRTVTIVCDAPHRSDEEAVTYKIEGGGKRGTVDLCDKHASLFLGLLLPAKRAQTRKPRTKYAATMDQVEAARAAS